MNKRGMTGEEVAPDLRCAEGKLIYWTHRPVAPWQDERWLAEMRGPPTFLRINLRSPSERPASNHAENRAASLRDAVSDFGHCSRYAHLSKRPSPSSVRSSSISR